MRTIRVTLASARQYVPPDQVGTCIARTRQLVEHARHEATTVSVISDIDALEGELRDFDEASDERQG